MTSKMQATETDFIKSSINTTSMGLNGQKGEGGMKPMLTGGRDNPGNTKPMKAPEAPVPMPK